MSRILLVGDVHLRDTAPVNCTHEFLVDLWHSLEWIADASLDFDATVFAATCSTSSSRARPAMP
jgi:hypothetical protein